NKEGPSIHSNSARRCGSFPLLSTPKASVHLYEIAHYGCSDEFIHNTMQFVLDSCFPEIHIFPLTIFHTPLHHGIIYSLIPCSFTSSPSPSACCCRLPNMKGRCMF
ncbi:hypothetical protein L9F63_016129, partial [Diploptera punctata]